MKKDLNKKEKTSNIDKYNKEKKSYKKDFKNKKERLTCYNYNGIDMIELDRYCRICTSKNCDDC